MRAHDVLKKMAELEASLDVPSTVARLTAPNPERDRVVARAHALMESELLALADNITKHPEIGFQEKRSIGLLVEYLRKHDFDVKIGVAGLETAFVARWKGGSGSPVLGVIVEYDALRGTQRRVSRRPAQRARPGRNGRCGRDGRVSGPHENTRKHRGVWDAG